MKNDTIEPLVYSIEDLTKVLKISKGMAYQLARSENFPIIRIGKRILVPAEGLKEWVLQNQYDI